MYYINYFSIKLRAGGSHANKKSVSPTEKLARDPGMHIQTAKKYVKKCTTSLEIREPHNETLLALLRMAKLKRLTAPSVGVVVVEGCVYYTFVMIH